MGRVYTFTGGTAVPTNQTRFQVTLSCGAEVVTRVRSLQVGQSSHAVAEMYDIVMERADGVGTGDTETPQPKEARDTAFSGMARSNISAGPATSGEPLFETAWNAVLGLQKVWRENEMPVINPSGAGQTALSVKVTSKGGAQNNVLPQVMLEIEEIG